MQLVSNYSSLFVLDIVRCFEPLLYSVIDIAVRNGIHSLRHTIIYFKDIFIYIIMTG